MAKVLIIKLGYSETLDGYIDESPSFGDILRTTVILHAYKDDIVTWLTDQKALPLLEKNKYIQRILPYNLNTVLQVQHERFDTVINLEKVPGICALSDSINAWRRFGFRFDETRGEAEAYDGAERVLALSFSDVKKKQNEEYWQQALMHMIGRNWKEEEYILGYLPSSKEKYDIGFNCNIGPKWPNKAWPKKYWEELESLLGRRYSISWQQGLNSLYEYMEWINSCRLIVTNDSLGLHIAIPLKKNIIALFGPTSSKEVFLYNRGSFVLPKMPTYKCIPCLKQGCIQKVNCMEFISPERVSKAIRDIL